MGDLIKWLTQDDQKDLFEILVALILNILFLGLIALGLWPLDRQTLALGLAKGYGVLWIVIGGTAVLAPRMQSLFRVNLYERANAYVVSNLAVSCYLQAGWSAFAALTVRGFVTGAPGRVVVVIVYLVGIVSCLIAFFVVSSVFQGAIYRLVSLPFALAGFLVFSVWPASGRALYGWFFRIF